MAKSNQELTDALSAPVGEFIAAVAKGVADAQQAMDQNTIETFQSVYMDQGKTLEELRKLGYQPTWYKIPELTAEINMALSISATALETGQQTALGRANKFALHASPVDASYINSFNYNANGASKVKFTIVPVPPTAQAENLKVMPFFAAERTLQDVINLLTTLDIPFQIKERKNAELSYTEEAFRAKIKAEQAAPLENPSATPIGDPFAAPVFGFSAVAGTILSPGETLNIHLYGPIALSNLNASQT